MYTRWISNLGATHVSVSESDEHLATMNFQWWEWGGISAGHYYAVPEIIPAPYLNSHQEY